MGSIQDTIHIAKKIKTKPLNFNVRNESKILTSVKDISVVSSFKFNHSLNNKKH